MNHLNFEYELYQHIFNEANCLWKHKLYSQIRPPSYFHNHNSRYLSYKIKAFFDISDLKGIEGDIETLKKLYLEEHAKFKHIQERGVPDRFPVIFDTSGEHIENALIRFEDAISSQKVSSIKSPAYQIGLLSREDLKSFNRDNDIPLFTRKLYDNDGNVKILCSLQKAWLIEQFGENAQIRKRTGQRSKATFQTPTKSIKTHAGFYLFNQSFEVNEINFPLRKRQKKIEYIKIPFFDNIQIKPSI